MGPIYYSQTHFQQILFLITQDILNNFQGPTNAHTNKKARVLRLQSRHQLFPQVFNFVQQYVNKKINFNGVDKRELGLEKYSKLVVERLCNAIYPDDSLGEPPLLPILNRYRPVGTTGKVDFVTTRTVIPSNKSQINAVVLHSGWEAEATKILDENDLVKGFAKNDHLGLTIAYEYLGVGHSYEPDFIVRMQGGTNLILEIKGFEVHEPEKTNAKHEAAKKWVRAVNNLKDFGVWDFLVCRETENLNDMLFSFSK